MTNHSSAPRFYPAVTVEQLQLQPEHLASLQAAAEQSGYRRPSGP